ncbi:uncharacterized protein [Pithys albifrons albifrons]|uniref:uncharacterized protein n=1 Tax=Pithys albifrons albifrons TaxID=3385563 RepID=UPI003A5CE57B
MGNSNSTKTNLLLDKFEKLARVTKTNIERQALQEFLDWCFSRVHLTDANSTLSIELCDKIGADLWNLVQTATDEFLQLIPSYAAVRKMVLEVERARKNLDLPERREKSLFLQGDFSPEHPSAPPWAPLLAETPPRYRSATPLPPAVLVEPPLWYPYAAPPAPALENPARPQQPWNQSFSTPFVTAKSQEVVFAPPYNYQETAYAQQMRPPAAAVEAAGPQQQPWNPTKHTAENQTVSGFYLNPYSEKARWGIPSAERDMWRGGQTPWSFSPPVHPPSALAPPPLPPMPCGYLRAEVALPPRSPPPCGYARVAPLRQEAAAGDISAGLETTWPGKQRDHMIEKPAKSNKGIARPYHKAQRRPNPPPYCMQITAHAPGAGPPRPTGDKDGSKFARSWGESVPAPPPPPPPWIDYVMERGETPPHWSGATGAPPGHCLHCAPFTAQASALGAQDPSSAAPAGTPSPIASRCPQLPAPALEPPAPVGTCPAPATWYLQPPSPTATPTSCIPEWRAKEKEASVWDMLGGAGNHDVVKKGFERSKNAALAVFSNLPRTGKPLVTQKTISEAFTAMVKPDGKHLATIIQRVVKSREYLSVSLAFVTCLVAVTNQNVWIMLS